VEILLLSFLGAWPLLRKVSPQGLLCGAGTRTWGFGLGRNPKFCRLRQRAVVSRTRSCEASRVYEIGHAM
jgi:hypothetical protein